jgi:toxin-antitoxin system PIN domain toxin
VTADLPDLNTLIALAWPNHVHHAAAARWFQGLGDRPWATCPLTQLGFVRLSSNPTLVEYAVTPREALALLAALTGRGSHQFWADDVDMVQAAASFRLVQGHRQVTDAYLLALASRRDARLITLDRRLRDLLPAGSPEGGRVFVLE